MPGTKIVNAISRGAELLKILAEGHNRLEDIYPIVGLNKSTTHRLLKSLVSSGLAYQNPLNRNYYLGPLFLGLSSNPTVSHQMLILSSIDELRKLRDSSGETCLLSIPNGNQRMILKEVRSKQKIALSLGDGDSVPMYVGSSGRTLLSQYTDKEINKILGKTNILPVGSKTIKDENHLRKEETLLREVCEKHAVSFEMMRRLRDLEEEFGHLRRRHGLPEEMREVIRQELAQALEDR